MKRCHIKDLLREILTEDGTMGNVTAAMSGGEGSPKTPNAFAKKGQGKNGATKTAEHLGYKTVKDKKYPYSTKMFDYKKL